MARKKKHLSWSQRVRSFQNDCKKAGVFLDMKRSRIAKDADRKKLKKIEALKRRKQEKRRQN